MSATQHGVFARLEAMLAPRWLYRDAHYLVADIDVDACAARRWVPSPLRPIARNGVATASIFLAWFPETSFGSTYHEAGLLMHVEHRGEPAVFSPWMLVDDDVALILGRELLGYPKKIGKIDLVIEDGRVRGVASRRGTELIRMEGVLHEEIPQPPPMLGRPHRNVSAKIGLSLPMVIAFTPREEPISVRRAELAISVGGSERDPLEELGFGAVRAAYLHRVNLGLGGLPLPAGAASPWWFVRHCLLRVH